VDRFILGDLDIFGSWGANIGSWLGARERDPDFLLLRYEDMLQDPAGELRKIAALLDVSASDERVEQAVANSSFQRMQALEQSQKGQWDSLKKTRPDMAFVRKGTQAQWREELPDESIRKIEGAWGPLMDRLGYARALT
jgi:hypothetical protein